MSTMRANTLANAAGTQSPDVVGGEFCRARFNLNGTGTIAARDTFNISSFVDNGVGDYSVNFAVAFPNAFYTASPTPRIEASGISVAGNGPIFSVGVSSYRFNAYYISSTGGAGSPSDYGWITDAIFGDKP